MVVRGGPNFGFIIYFFIFKPAAGGNKPMV